MSAGYDESGAAAVNVGNLAENGTDADHLYADNLKDHGAKAERVRTGSLAEDGAGVDHLYAVNLKDDGAKRVRVRTGSLVEDGAGVDHLYGDNLKDDGAKAERVRTGSLAEDGAGVDHLYGNNLKDDGVTMERVRTWSLAEDGAGVDHLYAVNLKDDGATVERVRTGSLVEDGAITGLGDGELTADSGITVWLTGLSGAGKSTIASLLTDRLIAHGLAAEWLDGDELRRALGKGLGFSREDRFENIRRTVYLAGMLNRHGVIAVVSVISPYAEMRDYARQSLPDFAEIYIDCPLEICETRDVKGLYAKARRGEIPTFTGISDPYEAPLSPDLTLRTAEKTPEESVNQIWAWLLEKKPAWTL